MAVHPDVLERNPMPQTKLHQVRGGHGIAVLIRRCGTAVEVVNTKLVIPERGNVTVRNIPALGTLIRES